LRSASVLIVSDDTEFARMVAARWQSERNFPEITLATSDVWHASSTAAYQLVLLGPVRAAKAAAILRSLDETPGTTAVYVTEKTEDASAWAARHPSILLLPIQDGWIDNLILLTNEILRRVDAAGRAQRAERVALEEQRLATLGRFMLEMRPSVNNALTSVLGNADLMLLEPGSASAEWREQLRTIHTMALRLNEVIQRFSSLAAEMRAGEKESQAETEEMAEGFPRGK
jgi:signal transduction histidine kinase